MLTHTKLSSVLSSEPVKAPRQRWTGSAADLAAALDTPAPTSFDYDGSETDAKLDKKRLCTGHVRVVLQWLHALSGRLNFKRKQIQDAARLTYSSHSE